MNGTSRETINPLARAFAEASIQGQYSKVMEGIGHVAVAVAYAELTIDMLGWALAGGELQAYLTLTKHISLGPKIDRVKDLCKTLIIDTSLKKCQSILF